MKSLAFAAAVLLAVPAYAMPIYESTFVAPSATGYGSVCSPCNGRYRAFDHIDLGASAILGRLEFQANAQFAVSEGRALDITVYDEAETVLWNAQFGAASIEVLPRIGGEPFTMAVDLPGWSVPDAPFWISLFGIEGNTFGWVQTPDLAGRGTYIWNSDPTDVSGFSQSLAMPSRTLRIFAGELPLSQVPAPAPFALLGLGALGLGLGRRRRAAD